MGRRNKYFELEKELVETDFGNWTMLMLFAKNLDKEKFKILNELTIATDNSKEELNGSNFNENKLSCVIDFLNQIINKLKNEKELIEKFGEEKGIIDLTNKDEEDDFPFLYEDDNLFYDNELNIKLLEDLRDKIFKKSLELRKAHSVYVL